MKKILLFCALAALSLFPSLGAGLEVPQLEQVWEQAEDYGVAQGEGLDQGLSRLFADALGQVGSLFRASLSTALKLIAVVLLCALAEGVRPEEEGGIQAVAIAGVLAITALTMTDMAVMIGLGRDTLGRMEGFSSVLLPVMAVLTAT